MGLRVTPRLRWTDAPTHSGVWEIPSCLVLSFSILAVSLTCTAVLASACSGAESQDVLSGTPGASSSSSSSSSSSGNSSGNGGSSSGASGATSSSGGSNCEPEEEPNDNEDEANELAPARCGTLTRRDKRDYLTFRLKPETKTMAINFTGRVRLRVDVDGRDTTELTPDSAGVVPFVRDADYFIEVTPLTDSNADINWRVEVVEN